MELVLNITNEYQGKSIKELLRSKGYSTRLIKRFKYEGEITLNGARVTVRKSLSEGDVLRLFAPEPKGLMPTEGELNILYRDSWLIALHKPSGLAVHPQGKQSSASLASILSGALKSGEAVHLSGRLDKPTSGVVLASKNADTAARLFSAFKARRVQKCYLALVNGSIATDEGEISLAIASEPASPKRFISDSGKPSLSRYRVLRREENHTLVLLYPITGRTHQLRVHLAAIGHPILGDSLYGDGESAPRLMLHALTLKLLHPHTEEPLTLYAPAPLPFPALSKGELALALGHTPTQHRMQLAPAPFEAICRGRKKIEMRLYDEKRKKISLGDSILFVNRETGEETEKSVVSLHRYGSFAELYEAFSPIQLGYGEGEQKDPKDMEQYYKREEISLYGVLGIGIE